MKKITVILLFLALSTLSFSQPTTKLNSQTKTDYLQKSKKQNTLAWIMLLGGFGLEVTAVVAAYETDLGANLVRLGFLSQLGSIPLFIIAHKNKKKSMHLSVQKEKSLQLHNNIFISKSFPSLTLRISL